MRYKAVLFDAGSTLWHWEYAPNLLPLQRHAHDPALVLLQAFNEAGAHVDARELCRCYDELQLIYARRWEAFETSGHGASDAEIAAHFDQHNTELLRLLNLPDPDGRLLEVIRDAFAAWRPFLFPEVREILEMLHTNGVAMAIVSNGWQQEADAKRLGIAPFFDAIVGSVYVGCCKPQPEIFGLALKMLGLSPAQAVHVGDSYEDDLIGAKNAGIAPILLDRDGTSTHNDVRTIRSLGEVSTLIIAAS